MICLKDEVYIIHNNMCVFLDFDIRLNIDLFKY